MKCFVILVPQTLVTFVTFCKTPLFPLLPSVKKPSVKTLSDLHQLFLQPLGGRAFSRMRIKKDEIKILKDSVRESDPDAEIYLFGSRTNDLAKGGDIDILVLSQRLTFKDQIKIKARIFKSLEEQAVHLVIAGDVTDPFVRVALNEGIPL